MRLNLQHVSEQERQKYTSLSLAEKEALSKQIIIQILKSVDRNRVGIAWTGGKDSTLLLWLVKQVCQQYQWPLPTCMFVDEGDVFDEINQFVEQLTLEWQVTVDRVHNRDVSSQVKKLGDPVDVKKLNQRNQKELVRLGYDQPTFPYLPESFVGNHLMKTVATNMWLEKMKISHLFVGVRWDEQGARAEDDFLRQLEKPNHFRVEPLLHITERDVWDLTKQHQLPYVSLYQKGYRSLGAKSTTDKVSDTPAWDQDIEHTLERAGRQQDKEKVMQRLRSLGYM